MKFSEENLVHQITIKIHGIMMVAKNNVGKISYVSVLVEISYLEKIVSHSIA